MMLCEEIFKDIIPNLSQLNLYRSFHVSDLNTSN